MKWDIQKVCISICGRHFTSSRTVVFHSPLCGNSEQWRNIVPRFLSSCDQNHSPALTQPMCLARFHSFFIYSKWKTTHFLLVLASGNTRMGIHKCILINPMHMETIWWWKQRCRRESESQTWDGDADQRAFFLVFLFMEGCFLVLKAEVAWLVALQVRQSACAILLLLSWSSWSSWSWWGVVVEELLFLGRRTEWMLGRTPLWAMVTPCSSLLSSSSFRTASCMWRGMIRVFLLSRDAFPASSSTCTSIPPPC